MATKAAAMPAAVLKKARRLTPWWRASVVPYSLTRASNSRCFTVCGAGMNSSLETDCVGIGDRKAEVSAGNNCWSSSGSSHPIALPSETSLVYDRAPADGHTPQDRQHRTHAASNDRPLVATFAPRDVCSYVIVTLGWRRADVKRRAGKAC